MKIASIDIGSNTVLLLIAGVSESRKLVFLENHYEIPRISDGILMDGRITFESYKRLKLVLLKYSRVIERHKCDVVLVNATNAFRIASNSVEITDDIYRETGIRINTISPSTEAKFAYLSATFRNNSDDNFGVIDIGGSSTEIIIGNKLDIETISSFQLGVVTLTQKFIKTFPPDDSVISLIFNHINDVLDEFNFPHKPNICMIAIAGTPTTLASMDLKLPEYNETKIDGYRISKNLIEHYYSVFRETTPEQLESKYGKIVSGRSDLMLAGIIILKSLFDKFNLEAITVSSNGVRHGAVIDYLNSRNQKNRQK